MTVDELHVEVSRAHVPELTRSSTLVVQHMGFALSLYIPSFHKFHVRNLFMMLVHGALYTRSKYRSNHHLHIYHDTTPSK